MAKMSTLEAQRILAEHEAIITGAHQNIEAKARSLTKEDIDAILVTPPSEADIYHSAKTYKVAKVHDVIFTGFTSGYIAYASMECHYEYDYFDDEFKTHYNSEESTNLDVILTGPIINGQFYINTIFAEQTPDEVCTNDSESITEQHECGGF